jgi:pilus assembly protein CpaC
MNNFCLVWGRLNKIVFPLLFFLALSSFPTGAQQTTPTITVTVNKSMVFRLAERAKRVSVSQPQVADVLVVAPSQLLINGKNVGTTSLIIFDEKGEVSNYDLLVEPDVGALRAQLRSLFPNEKIEISTSGPAIVLKGEVSNETVYDRVLEVATTYLPPKPPAAVTGTATTVTVNPTRFKPNIGSGFSGGGQIAFEDSPDMTSVNRFIDRKTEGIVDLLVIREVRQIELDVIVAEVAYSKLREIGFDILQSGKNFTSNTFIGSQAFGLIQPGSAVGATSPLQFNLPATSGIFRYVNGSYALATLYRMLQNKDVSEILAQPRLVIKNGRAGGFLSGGEIPIPQVTANNSTVEFKEFGVRLNFVPTITWSNRIDLKVLPEVSEPSSSLVVAGIPAITTKRSLTQVEMEQGDSLIIGGLLDRRITKDLNKFPILGDIPILGTLFRSTKFANRESELLFVITPRIVRTFKPGEKPQLPSIEKYDDPDIRQVPVPSGSEERRPQPPGASIP